MEAKRIAVIGAGSYGTCLAILLAGKGHDVALWCRSRDLAEELRAGRENTVYLPGYELPASVHITTELAQAVTGAHIVLGVTPSHAVRQVLGEAASYFDDEVIVVNASKGLELGTLDRIDQIYAEVFSDEIADRATYLSGPTFAKEVAAGQPSAIVVAGSDPQSAQTVQEAFSTERFRVYWSDDVIGVQIGGALKNVVAICAGMSDGLGFGHNARAALITRGLAEIARIGTALGANPLTFSGLSGLGDLVLTCAGDMSRNRQVGLALGKGKTLDEITRDMRMVAEGVTTTKVARDLAERIGVASPLADFAYGVLYDGQPAADGLRHLMSRALKAERG